MAVEAALAQQPVGLIGIKVIARLWEQAAHPFDLIRLFAEVGLHQAGRMLRPKRTEGRELLGRRGGRETRCDRIARAALAVPTLDQRFAVIIGRLHRVAQPFRGVAVHAGLARYDPLAAILCRLKQRVGAVGVDRAVRRDRGGAMGQRQVQIARGDVARIGGIRKAHLFGEGIGVEPVNQSLAPRGDDRGLRVMHMGIDKPRADQRIGVARHLGLRMVGTQAFAIAHGDNATVFDQDTAFGVDLHGILPGALHRVAGIGERRAQKESLICHASGLGEGETGNNTEASRVPLYPRGRSPIVASNKGTGTESSGCQSRLKSWIRR